MDENEQAKDISIAIRFSDVGSTLFNLHIGKQVVPVQLIMIGEYLKILGEQEVISHLTKVQHEAQMNQIMTPGEPIMDLGKNL